MSIISSMLAEFEHENTTTRKVLERVPEDKFGWKPHEKSWTLAQLASHVASVPSWAAPVVTDTKLELSPDFKPFVATTRKALLEYWEGNVAAAKKALSSISDSDLMVNWKMVAGGQTIIDQPRAAVLRGVIFNHGIHHRGQLSVYLRLLNVPVPAMYGPSADEAG